MVQWVYNFGAGAADGRAEMKNLLGGKGANLAEMASIGLPVPPGFTLTTEVCTRFYEDKCTYPTELKGQVAKALARVEERSGQKFGDATNPLLLSVRSGARASMPGMMDTVLNLGLNDWTVAALAKRSGDRRFAYDSYRRFVQMYSDVVLGIELSHFEKLLERAKQRRGVKQDHELVAEDLEKLVMDYKARVHVEIGMDFPEDPHEQLWGAVGAVFNSWMNQRAKTYRQLHDIPESWGTAVNVQAMVFGNMGSDCATGVAFTRNPSNGANDFYAAGKVVFSADEAVRRAKDGEKVLLVRIETSPDDIHGLHAAEGVLTTRGGMTSHAAVVARGMGRPCVAGAGAVQVDYAAARLSVGSVTVQEGQILTIDGVTGEVILGEVPTVPPQLSGAFGIIMAWADEYRTLQVRANAETPNDARQAKEFGAQGIGLVRTEHMFFDGGRIIAMRRMILAADEADRKVALEELLTMQREDITELFRIMDGRPVTVRLLDPPLHEFIPHTEAEMAQVAKAAGVPLNRVRRRAAELQEANPMLGHRGCRLAITYPEICEMQARAIFEAAAAVGKAGGAVPVAEVMVPLVATLQELSILKEVVEKTAAAVQKEQGMNFTYRVGTMIELPRACLQAGKLAEQAEFFSFGTNDLTQTTYGLSRDDAGAFLPEYKAKGIVEQDPFVSLDQEGVGELIKVAVERGRTARDGMKMGICGEHGGDPASIEFCNKVGLDYVSCSPFRVPVARLAAAQAALKLRGEKALQPSTKAAKPLQPAFGPW
ncbi:unnamed protein product [Effrenium voratum]|uniref:pyruvate, phosphate dikinase n=1 Tax=Effrenium voratum TaxID=2562239 RepID=A0AA36NAG1_9DINO|nr:unnamed protein product [Effrenium voratum]